MRISEEHMSILVQVVQMLLSKGAIERMLDSKRGKGCYSCCFLEPKNHMGLRSVVDLQPLNAFLPKDNF